MKKKFLNFLVTLLTVVLLATLFYFIKNHIIYSVIETLIGKKPSDELNFILLFIMFVLEPLICVGIPQLYLAKRTTKLGRFFFVASIWTLTWLVQLIYGFYMDITVYSEGEGNGLFSFLLFCAHFALFITGIIFSVIFACFNLQKGLFQKE